MWTGARNSPARSARERETRLKTGRWICGEASGAAAEKGMRADGTVSGGSNGHGLRRVGRPGRRLAADGHGR